MTIEPFEASLREHTPLTSISDPGALVEYLNQLNLKGDMVLDELKRVSSERDAIKEKLAEAEKDARDAWDEVANLRKDKTNGVVSGTKSDGASISEEHPSLAPTHGNPLGATVTSPTGSAKSRKGSLANLSLFSPKMDSADSPSVQGRNGRNEELFSYDNELPRLEVELQEKQEHIGGLQAEIKNLKGDLAVTRESTQSMATSLEEATRELHALRDQRDKSENQLAEEKAKSRGTAMQVKDELRAAEERLTILTTENEAQYRSSIQMLEKRLEEARHEIEARRSSEETEANAQEEIAQLQSTIDELEKEAKQLRYDAEKNHKRVDTLNGLLSNLRSQLKESENREQEADRAVADLRKALEVKVKELEKVTDQGEKIQAVETAGKSQLVSEATATGKKKNRKKRKGGKSGNETNNESNNSRSEDVSLVRDTYEVSGEVKDTIIKLQGEIEHLRALLEQKDAAIDNMRRKIKNQDDLSEEIESLREDLLNIGQEHVEVKEQCKGLLAEKDSLQKTIADLEKEIARLKAQADSTASSEQDQENLLAQVDDLKLKTISLQTDLSAANQLATSRSKELSDLRSIIQQAQLELNSLRNQNAKLGSVKELLAMKEEEAKRLDAKNEEMLVEITKLKRTMDDRDAEVESLNQSISQETSRRAKAEEASSKSAQEIQRLNTERRQANASIDRLSTELTKIQGELAASKAKLREVEQHLSKFRIDNEGLKEEAELKTAQYTSAQSLMSSMRDQTSEMAVQTKEAKERCEGLEEEIAEAHRLLSERSREGETMRRLLADVEARADARTREMKERMDTAMEERDRAEDEANTAGRRRARELEEMRNKVREAERNLKRAEDEKEELENAQRDWRRRREDLEQRSEQAAGEVQEVRSAMGELREALDESEKQARDLEKQKAELRRSVEETQIRLEKLQKSNKVCLVYYQMRRETNRLGYRPWPTTSEPSKAPRPEPSTPEEHRLAPRWILVHLNLV